LVLPNVQTAVNWGFLDQNEIERWVWTTQIFSLALLVAGAGAYVCCLWPLKSSLRKWIAWVIAPGVLGILGGVFLPAVIVTSQRTGSVLERFEPHPHRFWDFKIPEGMLLLNLGTGFRLAVVGLLLALVTAALLGLRKVSLPLRFGSTQTLGSAVHGTGSVQIGQKLFALFILALPWFAANVLSLLLAPVLSQLVLPALKDARKFSYWLGAAQYVLLALTFFLVAVWCLGPDRSRQLREAARLPDAISLGIGALIGAGAFFAPHLVAYAIDRVRWAQHGSGTSHVPVALYYLHFPPFAPYLVLTALASALSEWCWRGCAQPQLIRLLGIPRGLFVLGLLYGSVQSIGFPRIFSGLPEVFFNLLLMLISGLAWSVIYGWLAIRARSVWPSALCFALTNALVWGSGDDTLEVLRRPFMRLGLLLFAIVLAPFLIRYFPRPPEPEGAALPEVPPLPESA